jgi:hypothetical protein
VTITLYPTSLYPTTTIVQALPHRACWRPRTQQIKVRREINNNISRKKRRLDTKGKRKRRGKREDFRRRTGRIRIKRVETALLVARNVNTLRTLRVAGQAYQTVRTFFKN